MAKKMILCDNSLCPMRKKCFRFAVDKAKKPYSVMTYAFTSSTECTNLIEMRGIK